MRSLIVVMLMLSAACTTGTAPPPTTMYAKENVGYDVTRDKDVKGQYLASGVYAIGQNVDTEEVKWRTLLQGVEVARKDGYDLVVWDGPVDAGTDYTTTFLTRAGSAQTYAKFRGFLYGVRGYKTTDTHPPSARPIPGVIDGVNAEIRKRQLLK
jgi:hypothetical protein